MEASSGNNNKRKRTASASSADAAGSSSDKNTRNEATADASIVDNAGYWDGMGSSIADYDDQVFSSFDECENNVLRDAVERHANRDNGIALDIGCGPGLYLGALASRFAHVAGFDLSPNLVGLARRRMALQGTRNVSVAVRDLSAGRSLRAAVRANVAPALRKTAPPVKLFSRSFAEHFFFHTQGSSFPLSALCDFLLTGRSACARTCC